MEDLYRVRYRSSNAGCPAYWGGQFSPDHFEWDPDAKWHGDIGVVKKKYRFDSDEKSISFDFYDFSGTYVVSSEFLDACTVCNAEFDTVPLDVRLKGGALPKKRYFILLTRSYQEVLDRERSEFVDATSMETGDLLGNPHFPGARNYERIDLFVPQVRDFPPLFVCIETGDLFATDGFKHVAEENQLVGLTFELIDDGYRYDPIGDLLSP